MIRNILFLGAILISLSLSAQTQRCHSTEAFELLQEKEPAAAESILAERARLASANTSRAKTAQQGTLEIPVVVHVVYKTAQQNISDAQILSQITVLNQDFDKDNPDTSMIPAAFKPMLGDADIDFCLAEQDPNGFATNGITRTVTTENSFTFDDKVKDSSTGGKDPWPRNSYLNIWVCNLTGGLLGYAYPPGAPASLDGVVIGYNYFGSIDYNDGSFILSSPYNKGRTTTHEVGHWLNLDHIWGPGNGCQSDGASDTPLQDGSNFGCPNFPTISTCNGNDNGPDGDMFMNYMDYVDDNCMHMFSNSQANIMQNAVTISRASLLVSQGCEPGLAVSIAEESPIESIKVYPNPSIGASQLSLSLSKPEHVIVKVINSLGAEILRKDFGQLGVGEQILTLDLEGIAKGIVQLRIHAGTEVYNKALVITD